MRENSVSNFQKSDLGDTNLSEILLNWQIFYIFPYSAAVPRIKGIPNAFADENEQAEHQSQDKESRETQPRGMDVGFSLSK